MTGRKKSVSRQKTGGRRRDYKRDKLFARPGEPLDRFGEPILPAREGEPVTPLDRKEDTRIKKMRADLAKVPMGKMFGVQKFMDKYISKADRDLYLLAQEEYNQDARLRHLARADVDALKYYERKYYHEYDLIKEKHGPGQTPARIDLDAQVVRAWLDMQEPRWNKHRLVWFAEELTNQNFHEMASYVAHVEISGIPEEIWHEAESRGDF